MNLQVMMNQTEAEKNELPNRSEMCSRIYWQE